MGRSKNGSTGSGKGAKGKRRSGPSGGDVALAVATIAVTVTAIRRQRALPPEERTWHGTVDVPVPYDFRLPTVERITHDLWRPEDTRVFVPRIFGVGWTVNLARLLRRDEESLGAEGTRDG